MPTAYLRKQVAMRLHRRPCLWDVLICELSQALSDAYIKKRNHLRTGSFEFNGREPRTVGWMLATGFEILAIRNWACEPQTGFQDELWQLTEASAESIALRTAPACFDPLLRKYVEDTREILPARPHPDLRMLLPALVEALQTFLWTRCAANGDLHACLAEPLSDPPGSYFPDNGKPMEPAIRLGNPADDIYALGLILQDRDDGTEIKRKLVHFVRHDPWLFAEHGVFVEDRLLALEEEDRQQEEIIDINQATDDFLFRATHLDGKTPIQLLMERQRRLSETQRLRLLRWDAEAFIGTFLIRDVRMPFIDAVSLESNKHYRLEATRPEALRRLRAGDILVSRIVPWDDRWLLSGTQQLYAQEGKDPHQLARWRHELARRALSLQGDPTPQRVRLGFEIQEEQYQAWMELFGKEELLFQDGLELGAAMNRFYRYWNEEIIAPQLGMTRAESYAKDHGRWPGSKFALPDDLLAAQDVAAIFDQRHGLAFFVNYSPFRSAFASDAPLTDEQIEQIWNWLTDESIDYWLFERLRDEFPERTETVFRQILKDRYFELSKDFDRVLRKYKGEEMRRPLLPMITPVDAKAGDLATR